MTDQTHKPPMTMGEIVEAEGGNKLVANQSTESQMIAVIADIASNPDTDVEKMEKMLDIQIRLMDRQAKIDFDQALSGVQSEMPRIQERGEIKNKHGQVTSRYMKYEDIDLVIRPLLKKYGFSLMHTREEANGKMNVTTKLKHEGGHEETVSIPLPYDQVNALKNAVQAAVSTFSYGKRVNVCSLLNIVAEGEDDDGQRSEAFTITDQQSAEIKGRLEALYNAGIEVDTQKFLKYMGCSSVDEIPASKYETAVQLLDRKEKAGV